MEDYNTNNKELLKNLVLQPNQTQPFVAEKEGSPKPCEQLISNIWLLIIQNFSYQEQYNTRFICKEMYRRVYTTPYIIVRMKQKKSEDEDLRMVNFVEKNLRYLSTNSSFCFRDYSNMNEYAPEKNIFIWFDNKGQLQVMGSNDKSMIQNTAYEKYTKRKFCHLQSELGSPHLQIAIRFPNQSREDTSKTITGQIIDQKTAVPRKIVIDRAEKVIKKLKISNRENLISLFTKNKQGPVVFDFTISHN